MNSLTILHRFKSSCDRPLSTLLAVNSLENSIWATCLREIAFVSYEDSENSTEAVKGLEIHREEGALIFLLEVLCGLKSPVIGETEVLGQFKSFLNQIPADHPLKREPSLVPFLQQTVKEARTKFIKSAGSLSYGQVVRRWLKEYDDAVLWGFGSLGTEIWPWVRQKTKSVVVRSARAVDEEIPFVIGKSPKASAHIVAAPLSDEKVKELAQNALVIDLRDNAVAAKNIKTLQHLFAELKEMRKEREDILPVCRQFLREKSNKYLDRSQIRPFGWEDLCG